MTNLTWHSEKRKVKELVPADYNPRQITEMERQDLMNSITEFGMVVPVVINLDNKMIGGHQRISIYADLQIEEIDVQVPDRQLTLEEEMRLNLRLNKNTGTWDTEKLSEMDMDMLLDVGFGDTELSEMWDNVDTMEDGFNEKKAVGEAQDTKIKKGEIFELGEHRLMCGDSTSQDDVSQLMGDKKAGMIYCDPPYNIGLDYEKGISTSGKYQVAARKDTTGDFPDLKYKGFKVNDSKKTEAYKSFLEMTMIHAIAHSEKDVHIFYWCDENYIWLLQDIYQENAIMLRRVCMWIKNNFNMTPQVAFNKVYEPCVYGTIGRPFLNPAHKNLNEVMNKEVLSGNQVHDEIFDLFNIWLVKRDNAQDYEHPTQKPVTLHEKALKRCTAPGTIVVDLFGGSGSTLIACEQLKRKCFTMEMNPIFAQVIINRYEKYSGNKAKKIN